MVCMQPLATLRAVSANFRDFMSAGRAKSHRGSPVGYTEPPAFATRHGVMSFKDRLHSLTGERTGSYNPFALGRMVKFSSSLRRPLFGLSSLFG